MSRSSQRKSANYESQRIRTPTSQTGPSGSGPGSGNNSGSGSGSGSSHGSFDRNSLQYDTKNGNSTSRIASDGVIYSHNKDLLYRTPYKVPSHDSHHPNKLNSMSSTSSSSSNRVHSDSYASDPYYLKKQNNQKFSPSVYHLSIANPPNPSQATAAAAAAMKKQQGLSYPHQDHFDFRPPTNSTKIQHHPPPLNMHTSDKEEYKKPTGLQVDTNSDPAGFSFSEHDTSIQDFVVSPAREVDGGEDNLLSASPPTDHTHQSSVSSSSAKFNSTVLLPFVEVPEFSPNSNGSDRTPSPVKSVSTSLNSNTLGSIIGGYNYSGSSIEVGGPSAKSSGSRDMLVESKPIKANLNEIITNNRNHSDSPQVHTPSQTKPFSMYIDYPIAQQQSQQQPSSPSTHVRNSSESSTTSNASTTSTLTPSSASTNASKDKRFVRYVMNTQQSKAAVNSSSNKWNMENVIKWLDTHNFHQTWKDTFKRNEISGNRFLELCNYEADSIIWKQFGKLLYTDGMYNTIPRFISLLKDEMLNPSPATEEEKPLRESSHSRKGSNDSVSSSHHQNSSIKAEHRKSALIFSKYKSGTTTNSNANISSGSSSNTLNNSTNTSIGGSGGLGVSNNLNAHGNSIKPRPFSYIPPSSQMKKEAASSGQSYKFFRKHYRSSSIDQIDEQRDISSAPTSANSTISHEFPTPLKKGGKGTSTSLTDESSVSPAVKSPQLIAQNSNGTGISGNSNPNNSKKERILSTFRKYGGDKAAEMVKHVQPSTNSQRNSLIFPKTSSSEVLTPVTNNASTTGFRPPRRSSDHSISSFRSSSSLTNNTHERSPVLTAASGALSATSTPPSIEVTQADALVYPEQYSYRPLEEKYLPKPLKSVHHTDKVILVTKDNKQFFPVTVPISNVEDDDDGEKKGENLEQSKLQETKSLVIKELGLIDIGLITFHLTDFNSEEGEALPNTILFNVLRTLPLPKLVVRQELSSPSINTYSTTSSDSKSFELKGENNDEKFYPATPQYLLQNNSSDSKTDYWNFKETANDRLSKINESPDRLAMPSSSAKARASPSVIANQQQQQQLQQQLQQHLLSKKPTSQNNHFALKLDNNNKLLQRKKVEGSKVPSLSIDTKKAADESTVIGNNGLTPSPSNDVEPIDSNASIANSMNTFRVLRKEGREIDFDKRRKSPFETKAPKLIPSIYQSSAMDSINSPISATTVHPFTDSNHSPLKDGKPDESAEIRNAEENGPQQDIQPKKRGAESEVAKKKSISSIPDYILPVTRERSVSSSSSIIAKRVAPLPPPLNNSIKRNGSDARKRTSSRTSLTASPPVSVASADVDSVYSSRSNSGSDKSFTLKRGLSKLRGGSVIRKATTLSREDPFKTNEISFEDIPDDDIINVNSNSESDEDDFFVKPVKKVVKVKNNDDEDDDDFFMKPISDNGSRNSTQRKNMSVRPPIDEVYSNLEKYFPNTNLDKPIIDDSPVSPVVTAENSAQNFNSYNSRIPQRRFPSRNVSEGNEPAGEAFSKSESGEPRRLTISRTFSNANISPIAPPADSGDDVFYGESKNNLSGRRRMKTIRIVANEARRKRLEQQKNASPQSTYSFEVSRNNSNGSTADAGNKTFERDRPLVPNSTNPEADANTHGNNMLFRRNTKMWGQKVTEVTSKEIEKGFVSKIRNNKNGEFVEFAWIKGELIGRGSFGAVYLALNVTTGEMLAVKQVVVPKDRNRIGSKTVEGIEALHKEVETMKDLDHINIVQYLGFEQKDNIYSMFLEYVAGGSIALCMKSYGPFEEKLVTFITRQILLGLQYLHQNGILHRDLKADNLLLEVDGRCKISDFGISKKSSDIYVNNAEMSMQGTIFWMAPEVIDSIVEDKKQGYSAKIDIWSLGCVVLEMFCGKRPWSNEAVVSAIYKIGKTKLAPPIPSDINDKISVGAKDFIKKCFTIDPEARPTATELLEHDFIKEDEHFSFQDTKLAQLIKFNSRKSSTGNEANS
ncbi:hypothetical protein CLIB1423_20S01904 [[Candida] railenensis]|uniref:mitogen-activated protein kinase kinase kinase n=1 Tax=[Candida] railenensis TaxID=45579 RepID=A0A9P0QVB6_9ASCO|nr:hypothetical protein CLIB1423_20S01904 [[Candida] railenensis]